MGARQGGAPWAPSVVDSLSADIDFAGCPAFGPDVIWAEELATAGLGRTAGGILMEKMGHIRSLWLAGEENGVERETCFGHASIRASNFYLKSIHEVRLHGCPGQKKETHANAQMN